MTDLRLMKRFRNGDPTAVGELYRRYGRAVFTVALRALGDRMLAEEATQQTFLNAWQAAARFDLERPVGPWLYAIARRVAVDVYRRERRHRADRFDEVDMAALPSSFEGMWEAWEIRCAIDRLTADERHVIEAIHYRGLTYRQAADELGIPLGTVKSRSHRAHQRLAELLAHLREATA